MADTRVFETVQLDEQVFRTDLETGPIVLSEQVPSARSVAVGLWVRWGASHDAAPHMGAAHLLEHMIFKGTERRSARDIALEIEGIGGALDAYTSREHTACQANVLDEHLPIAVDVLTDLVFRPLLRDSDLSVERRVILEEIAGVEDAPEELVFDLHARALWGEHPYGSQVLGTTETVQTTSVDDLRDLWARAYRPGACVLAAAGNLQHEELLDLVTEYVPQVEGPWEIPSVPEPTSVAPEDVKIQKGTAQTHVCIGSRTFARGDARRFASILVSTALGAGMSSRLFQRVREELGLAYAIYSFQSFYARGGLSGVYIATGPDTAERAVQEVREELSQLAQFGLPGDELAAVKKQAKGNAVLSLESTSARLHRLAGVAVYDEPYLTLDEICRRIDAIGEEDVAKLCEEFYAPERQAIVRLGPEESA